jgi:arsenate reductase-like glutaredoxin family protein
VKERGWGTTPPSKADFVRAVLDDPNVLRRPVLIVGKRAVVGKDEAAVRSLLA